MMLIARLAPGALAILFMQSSRKCWGGQRCCQGSRTGGQRGARTTAGGERAGTGLDAGVGGSRSSWSARRAVLHCIIDAGYPHQQRRQVSPRCSLRPRRTCPRRQRQPRRRFAATLAWMPRPSRPPLLAPPSWRSLRRPWEQRPSRRRWCARRRRVRARMRGAKQRDLDCPGAVGVLMKAP